MEFNKGSYFLDYAFKDINLVKLLEEMIIDLDYDLGKVRKSLYVPGLNRSEVLDRVSEAALSSLGGMDRAIASSDCSLYNINNFAGDQLVEGLMKEFEFLSPLKIICSGRFWYPVNGYMGWHTNSNNYGYRFYCTYVPEGGKSFFRYRDPLSGQIITSWDRVGWSFRLFRISSESLWHCVYSETDRISIGYTIFVS